MFLIKSNDIPVGSAVKSQALGIWFIELHGAYFTGTELKASIGTGTGYVFEAV